MIIDAHTHLPAEGWRGNPAPFSTVREAVAYLKAAGTTAALFNTWQGVLAESEDDLDRANAQALDLAGQYEGFLYPGVVIYPAWPEASLRWLARFREAGHRWVGELVLEKGARRYDDPGFMELFVECARHDHVVQLHVHEDIIAVARRFPKMTVVCSPQPYPALHRHGCQSGKLRAMDGDREDPGARRRGPPADRLGGGGGRAARAERDADPVGGTGLGHRADGLPDGRRHRAVFPGGDVAAGPYFWTTS